MAELINKSKEFLGVGQRKRRAQHFEFSTDPLTGFRSNTGTYSNEGGIRVCGDAVLHCFWCGFSEIFFQPAVLRFSKTVRFAVI